MKINIDCKYCKFYLPCDENTGQCTREEIYGVDGLDFCDYWAQGA